MEKAEVLRDAVLSDGGISNFGTFERSGDSIIGFGNQCELFSLDGIYRH
jgi:hypothetical protein